MEMKGDLIQKDRNILRNKFSALIISFKDVVIFYRHSW